MKKRKHLKLKLLEGNSGIIILMYVMKNGYSFRNLLKIRINSDIALLKTINSLID